MSLLPVVLDIGGAIVEVLALIGRHKKWVGRHGWLPDIFALLVGIIYIGVPAILYPVPAGT